MDSYKVFQSVFFALVLSSVLAIENAPCEYNDEDAPCNFEKVRLLDGDNEGGGLAEVMCNDHDVWGTISDDENWNDATAAVFCRELGFDGGERINGTKEGSGPVLNVECDGSESSMRDCIIRTCDSDDGFSVSYEGMDDYYQPLWSHTNDAMLKCKNFQAPDSSKFNMPQMGEKINIGQDSPEAVMITKTSSFNITWLVVADGIEFVLLLVAVVVTSLIVYRKATLKMKSALKENRSPESQAMLDLSQVTVQDTTTSEQKRDLSQPGGSGGW